MNTVAKSHEEFISQLKQTNLKIIEKPQHWLEQARAFKLATKHLIAFDLVNIKAANITEKFLISSMTQPFFFLLANTVELYLKGYLRATNMPLEEIRKKDHDLELLLYECQKHSSRFDDSEITFFVNNYGNAILQYGGL